MRAAPGDSPVLDGSTLAGSGPTTISAIELLSGVSGVTIEGLEIRNFKGDSSGNDRSSGILAASGTTSGIKIRNNNIHDNFWNGVLVFSSGGFIHDTWKVVENMVTGNGFVNIEFTNCSNCKITDNNISGSSSLFGVVVQARNTVAGSGLTAVSGVNVMHNIISGITLYGVYVLSFTGDATAFTPIAGASTLLTSVNVQHNKITDSGSSNAVRFWSFNAAATAENGRISNNIINCVASDPGISILESGIGGTGTVKNVKVVNNKIDSDCSPAITNTAQATKLPPGGPFP